MKGSGAGSRFNVIGSYDRAVGVVRYPGKNAFLFGAQRKGRPWFEPPTFQLAFALLITSTNPLFVIPIQVDCGSSAERKCPFLVQFMFRTSSKILATHL